MSDGELTEDDFFQPKQPLMTGEFVSVRARYEQLYERRRNGAKDWPSTLPPLEEMEECARCSPFGESGRNGEWYYCVSCKAVYAPEDYW